MSSYTETGGISYGGGTSLSMNFSWPFVKLTAGPGELVLRVSLGRLWNRTFALEHGKIRSIRKTRGLACVGMVIEHTHEGYPPDLIFWTFHYPKLKEQLEALGYEVEEGSGKGAHTK